MFEAVAGKAFHTVTTLVPHTLILPIGLVALFFLGLLLRTVLLEVCVSQRCIPCDDTLEDHRRICISQLWLLPRTSVNRDPLTMGNVSIRNFVALALRQY